MSSSRLVPRHPLGRVLMLACALALGLAVAPRRALADKDNVVSLSGGFGEAYGVGLVRLSLGSYDVTYDSPMPLSVGKRLWKQNFYAGFGAGLSPGASLGWYGMVGYEWRPLRVVGVFFEANGATSLKGETAAFGVLGLTVGW